MTDTLTTARWLRRTIRSLTSELFYAEGEERRKLVALKAEHGKQWDELPRWAREEAECDDIEAARRFIETKCCDDESASRLMRFIVGRSEG